LLNNTPASTFAVEQEARKWRRHYEGDW